MQHRMACFEGQAFDGMPGGVAEIQGFPDIGLQRIAGDKVILDFHGMADELPEFIVIGHVRVKTVQFREMRGTENQSVLYHFRKSRKEVHPVEGFQKRSMDQNGQRLPEGAYFILQPAEVDAGFPADRGVDL